MHIWYFYPPYKHSLYRMNATHTASACLMSEVPKQDLRLKTERGLDGGEQQGIQQSHASNDMTCECLERHVSTSHPGIRTTCIYTFLHLYIVSGSLSEEFMSPVILLTGTEAWLLEHEHISMCYDALHIFPVQSQQGTILKSRSKSQF